MAERNNKILKVVDRYAGIPVVVALGIVTKLTRGKRNSIELPKRIAVMKTAAIGDTVLLSAIVKDLRNSFPEAEIVFFSGASNYAAAEMIADLDQVIKLPIKNIFAAIKTLRLAGRFDYFCDFDSWPRLNALYSFFVRAYLKIGFKTKGQYRHYVYDCIVGHDSTIHELDNYRKIVNLLDIETLSSPVLVVPEVGNEILGDYLVFHIFAGGSRSYMKEWAIEKWAQLADYFAKKGETIVFTGTVEQNTGLNQILTKIKNKDKVINMAGKYDLSKTAALISKAKVTISVDTGIMHIASALNVPVVALHGPTHPDRWGGIGLKVKAIRKNVCSACISLGFDNICKDNICMTELSVEDVVEVVDGILEREES